MLTQKTITKLTLSLASALFISACNSSDENQNLSPAGSSNQSQRAQASISYKLVKVDNPNTDQKDAYAKITKAMDAAVDKYNQFSDESKSITVYYKPSIETSNANASGVINFGSNRRYITTSVAVHEISHTLGLGTNSKWSTLVDEDKKEYTGAKGKAALKAIDANATLKADKFHFWPYGLGNTTSASETEIKNHIKIVIGIKNDGV